MSGARDSSALPVGYRLEEYVIEKVLGHGGFGITYLARDSRLGARVAIKEYFPQAYAHRDRTLTIHPNSSGDTGDAENYRWGLQEFLKEARALAQFKHTNIVRVLRFLEANGTAYMAMEYEEGESLADHLAHQGGFLGEQALLSVFLPILNGLQAVHDAGLLHLDIKPDNIYLRRSGPPMLIDFGAARQRSGENRSAKVALTPGYAALEQYPGHGELGAWSDVYSMGATLYRCITGREPVDSSERERGLKKLRVDPLIPATRFDRPLYSAHIRSCVDAAMTLTAEERPKTAFALQNGLMGKSMTEVRKGADSNAFSRGPGFIGVVAGKEEGRKKRFIPRGPLERLLVFTVFLAVLIVAPARILVAFGYISEDELYDRVAALHMSVIDGGKRVTRYVEENLLGISRPPEYTPPPPALHNVARAAPVPKTEAKALPPFEPTKQLAVTHAVGAAVTALAFVQDGRQLAVALEDGTIELRHADTGVLVRTLMPATGVAGAVATSADGKRLAFSAAGHAIHLWDMERNIFLGELPGHLDAIAALAFSPDGRLLASASRDQSAALWDVETAALLTDLSRPANEPTALAFSPDGARLAVGDTAGGIRYWDLATRRDIAYVPTRDLPITALAYSPDGGSFAVGGEQGFLSLWDVSGRREDRALHESPDTVHALAFSPDGKWLIVAGSDAMLQLWDVGQGVLAERYNSANHQTYALALAPEGKQIAAAGIDARLTIWR